MVLHSIKILFLPNMIINCISAGTAPLVYTKPEPKIAHYTVIKDRPPMIRRTVAMG